jgi:hypothetical protein
LSRPASDKGFGGIVTGRIGVLVIQWW